MFHISCVNNKLKKKKKNLTGLLFLYSIFNSHNRPFILILRRNKCLPGVIAPQTIYKWKSFFFRIVYIRRSIIPYTKLNIQKFVKYMYVKAHMQYIQCSVQGFVVIFIYFKRNDLFTFIDYLGLFLFSNYIYVSMMDCHFLLVIEKGFLLDLVLLNLRRV